MGNVLTPDGKLQFSGYLSYPTLKWDPSVIESSFSKSLRFKKWDFYSIYLKNLTLCVAVADLYYAKNAFVTIYQQNSEPITYEKLIFPHESVKMSETSLSGITFYNSSSITFLFTNNHENYKQIIVQYKHIDINLQYRKESDQEGMVYLGPFNSEMTQFFYSHKQYNYKVDGYVKIANEEYILFQELGMMDWGRGIWPYHGGWIWGSGLGKVGQTEVGLNIGELPKDQVVAGASDDCIILNKTMIKLGVVNFEKEENGENWGFFTVNNEPDSRFGAIKGRFVVEKTFNKNINFWLIKSKLVQLFGNFEGEVVTKESKFKFEIRGILEVHESRW